MTTSETQKSKQDPLLTYQDVARVANVKLGTVYMWRKRGRLPDPAPETVSRRPVWRLSVINSWLEATGRKGGLGEESSN